MPDRKYVLTKLAAGDYLLPSNDGHTLWRIRLYTEGPSSGLDWERDEEVWGVWCWTDRLDRGGYVDTEDWGRWDFHEGLHKTRREAVDAALSGLNEGECETCGDSALVLTDARSGRYDPCPDCRGGR